MQRSVERKVIDVGPSTRVCTTTGTVSLMNPIAAGTDFTERIGRKITAVAVQLSGTIKPTAAVAAQCRVKILVLYDAQPNGALPAVTDILTAATPNSFMNLNNRDRFKILIEDGCDMAYYDANNGGNNVLGSPTTYTINKYKKINLPSVFDGTGGAITDFTTGSIILLTIGDYTGAQSYTATIASRIRFTDQ